MNGKEKDICFIRALADMIQYDKHHQVQGYIIWLFTNGNIREDIASLILMPYYISNVSLVYHQTGFKSFNSS